MYAYGIGSRENPGGRRMPMYGLIGAMSLEVEALMAQLENRREVAAITVSSFVTTAFQFFFIFA